MGMAVSVVKRSVVCIDGFNLYYGAVRGTPYRWLDLERFFRLARPHDDIQAIRYFTALISGPTRPHQETYLQALATLPLVEIVLGRFKTKRIRCRVEACSYTGNRLFPQEEEKHTDVNIGVRMLDDAYQDVCDRFILVSGDSDLVPAVRMVKTRFPSKEVILYVPATNPVRGAAVELRAAADKDRLLPLQLLTRAQLPARVPDASGGYLTKPPSW